MSEPSETSRKLYETAHNHLTSRFESELSDAIDTPVTASIVAEGLVNAEGDEKLYSIRIHIKEPDTPGLSSDVQDAVDRVLTEQNFSNNQFAAAVDARGRGYRVHVDENVNLKL